MRKSENIVKKIRQRCAVQLRNHAQDFAYPTHWHDYYEFEFVAEGEYEHLCNGVRRRAAAGEGWILSGLDFHSLRAVKDSRIVNISFTPDFLPNQMAEFINLPGHPLLFCLPGETLRYTVGQCVRLEQELACASEALQDAMVSALFSEILITAIRHSAVPENERRRVVPQIMRSAALYIQQNYQKDIALSEIAERQNVSAAYLGSVFKSTYGCSFHEYLNKLRLKCACDMLRSTSMTAREIASACGYRSTEYFYSVFRKYLDMTPVQYRNTGAPPFP